MGYEIPPDHHGSLPSSQYKAAEGAKSPEPNFLVPPPSTHQQVIIKLSEVQKLLKEIHSIALGSNPLCAAIPVFIEIEKLGKDMSRLMQEVNKLRGL